MGFSKDLVVASGSGNYLKTPPGQTRVRIVSDAVRFFKDFENKQQYMTEELAKTNPLAKPRYAMWVIDRADGQVKMWETSGGMIKDLQNLSENPDYAYDTPLMPYDIVINRVGTTQNDTRYTITAARQNTALTAEEVALIESTEPMAMFLQADSEEAKTGKLPPPFLS